VSAYLSTIAAAARPRDPAGTWRALVMAQRYRVALLFGVAVVLQVLRYPEALLRAEFFADDGFLYSMALAGGPGTMVEPYAGYLVVPLRAAVWVETLVPPAAAPLLGNAIAIAMSAAAAAFAVSRRMPWSTGVGTAIAVAIVLLPASWPLIGNLSHLMWPAALWTAFVALSTAPRSRTGKWVEGSGLFAAGLTGPPSVMLIPLFIAGPRFRLLPLATAAAMQLFVLLSHDRASLASLQPEMLSYVMLMRGVVTPLLGPSTATLLTPLGTVIVGGALLTAIALLVVQAPRRIGAWVTYLALVFPLSGILMAGVPTGWYANAELFPRYFWLVGVALVVLLLVQRRVPLALPVAVALLVGIVSEWRIDPAPGQGWSERSGCIGGAAPCEVPVAPLHVWNVIWTP
jgi:hypothetical protein